MRIKLPNKAKLRMATLTMLIVMCTLVILSAVFPFPEGSWDFLSIGISQKTLANPDGCQNCTFNATFYPDANPESSSVDGYVYRDLGATGEPWSTVRDSAGTHSNDSATESVMAQIASGSTTDYWQYILRGITVFDIAELDADATITNATLSFRGSSKGSAADWDMTVNVYSADPASNTAIAAADYQSFGETPLCNTTIDYDNWAIDGWNDFVLNDAGLALLNNPELGLSQDGAAAVQLPTSTVDAFGMLVKTGDDTIIYFTSEGPEWYAGDWKLVKNEYTISTQSWGNRTTVYDDDTWCAFNVAGGVIGDHVYIFFGRYTEDVTNWVDAGYIVSTNLTCSNWSSYTTFEDESLESYVAYGHIVPTTTAGTYLLPFYGTDDDEPPHYVVKMLKTTNYGTNWTVGATAHNSTSVMLTETCIEHIGNGEMIAHSRNNAKNTYIMQMTSDDNGETWSSPNATALGTNSDTNIPWLFYDSSSDIVFSIYHDRDNQETGACVANATSVFNSSTAWPTATTLDTGFTYFGYPSIVETDPDEYIYVYSKWVSSTDADTWGGNASLTKIVAFGQRNANYDVADSPPEWAASKVDYIAYWTADKGTGYKPTLVINYTLPAEITNTPSSIDFGILEVNGTGNTAINYFTIENTGSCAVDVVVYGTDATGGDDTWTLSDTATPGENIYGLKAGLDDDDDTFDVIVRKTETYNTLASNLTEDATQDWGLKIWMPTSLSGYDCNEMAATVTLVASEAS